ncbi:uncharacterized protein CANTADRAFT_19293 [Suhomyces tanzawaensis NRRL Y-17324]|uniref:Cell wall protein n=1 Tax=Suhomyces tanzawaensis NRRL Y-17324 TaxID=984487 RepID=A0A1E4SQ88_9ASCO|nr:uncharacterized protein CANTADRAFT_19293 [Suhomyces tanzawaensis NRRL Y-17324]ODV81674.1 hypothetical protein CANTADRAFT_19293 [Suhomyces tanzawaensis NRRL Y-17324]
MQFLNTLALATLAAFVAADQSFTLVANGDGISNSPVTSDGQQLTLDNGNTAQIDLQEPSGFAQTGGKFLTIDSNGISFTDDNSKASKDWGFVDGKFRSGPSIDQADFFACKADKGYTLINYQKDGCVAVSLSQGGAPAPSSAAPSSAAPSSSEAPSSAAPSSEAPSSAAPSSDAEVTKTAESHTLVTVTDCASTVTDCPARQSSSAPAAPTVPTANGAAAVGAGAGAVMVAAAALML